VASITLNSFDIAFACGITFNATTHDCAY
jgi:hypothetical protein